MTRPFVYRYTRRGRHMWLVGAGRSEHVIGSPHTTWARAYTAALKIASKVTPGTQQRQTHDANHL